MAKKKLHQCKDCFLINTCSQLCTKVVKTPQAFKDKFLSDCICPDCGNSKYFYNTYWRKIFIKCQNCNHEFSIDVVLSYSAGTIRLKREKKSTRKYSDRYTVTNVALRIKIESIIDSNIENGIRSIKKLYQNMVSLEKFKAIENSELDNKLFNKDTSNG